MCFMKVITLDSTRVTYLLHPGMIVLHAASDASYEKRRYVGYIMIHATRYWILCVLTRFDSRSSVYRECICTAHVFC